MRRSQKGAAAEISHCALSGFRLVLQVKVAAQRRVCLRASPAIAHQHQLVVRCRSRLHPQFEQRALAGLAGPRDDLRAPDGAEAINGGQGQKVG